MSGIVDCFKVHQLLISSEIQSDEMKIWLDDEDAYNYIDDPLSPQVKRNAELYKAKFRAAMKKSNIEDAIIQLVERSKTNAFMYVIRDLAMFFEFSIEMSESSVDKTLEVALYKIWTSNKTVLVERADISYGAGELVDGFVGLQPLPDKEKIRRQI